MKYSSISLRFGKARIVRCFHGDMMTKRNRNEKMSSKKIFVQKTLTAFPHKTHVVTILFRSAYHDDDKQQVLFDPMMTHVH